MTATYCAVNTKRINRKKKTPLVYPNLEFAIRPILHCNEVPVPVFKGLPELELHSSEGDQAFVLSTDSSENTVSDVSLPPSLLPQLFSQGQLSDLIRDLNLFKESSEFLASRLKEKNLFHPGTLITYKKCHIEFLPYFTQENDIVYCNNVAGLLQQLGVQQYDPQNWRLFINSSKKKLKCVLHNGNLYGSVPLGNSTTLKKKMMKSNLFWKKFHTGSYVSIWKWLGFSTGYKLATQNFLASCVCGTAGQEQSTG